MNAGVYLFKKQLINKLNKNSSLENDILPKLIKKLIDGLISKDDFIDIGLKKI